MSTDSTEELSRLLAECFQLQKKSIPAEELLGNLNKIKSIHNLNLINQDVDAPLWPVVPQIAMHQFGLSAFKELNCTHKINKSFVFIHPLHLAVADKLKKELSTLVNVGKEIDITLTEEVIAALYGGYQWHSAYARACAHFDSIGKTARIIILDDMDDEQVNAVIDYKNAKRDVLSPRKVVGKEKINTGMDGIINSFHSPDLVENTRQMIALGLIDRNEISNV